MTVIDPKMSADEWDELNFPRPEGCDFDRVVESALSRRGFLSGLVVFGSGAAVMGSTMLTPGAAEASERFPFTPVPPATDATVHVPEGYKWDILVRWGDPLFSDAAGDWNSETGGSAAMANRVFGENTDGMELFNIGGREIIAINSEYTNRTENLPQAPEGVPQSADDVLKLQRLQGVNIMEIEETDAGWRVVVDSPFNRRIDHNTTMELTGPAAGHDLVKTAGDPTGMTSMGTMNNCGSGRTPWGTYLTCEENFNGYFGANNGIPESHAAGFKRYGVGEDGWGYDYHKWDARFDVSENPNEPHCVGYIVEIDPANPDAAPKKRTALGRFKHENAAATVAPDGRVVVYMGDDERGEFMYKWISRDAYTPGGDTESLLVEGQLYVAKFNDDGTGEWIALTPAATGMDEANIAIFTRMAASAVGATTMDRPEWIAVNPVSVEAYCCLTNNSRRGIVQDDGTIRPNAGGDPMTVNGPNPRAENNYGQIVRWRPHGDNHGSNTFDWDLYVMAGNPAVHEDAYGGSANVNEGNMFNGPDGMVIDSTGMIWIQTDGNYRNEGDFEGMGNNVMLVGDPVSGRIERFMTGPFGCEVTGACWSSDKRTLFVGIQHPAAPFPDGEGQLPRSSVIAIKREDNAKIG
jgi:secreted PhoX family phosphatase